MNAGITVILGALIACTWGRYFLQLAAREIRVRRSHYRWTSRSSR